MTPRPLLFCLFILLFVVVLCKRVSKDSQDGRTRADDGLDGHRVTEDHDGRYYYYYPLNGVGHCVRDRVQGLQGLECHLWLDEIRNKEGRGGAQFCF